MNTKDPIKEVRKQVQKAEKAGLPLANGMCVSTAGPDGRPSSRMMLLKAVTDTGFVFYTNLESRKSRELAKNPFAALCFWWPVLERQIRIEGKVELVSNKEADAYFATRPRGSQLGAWVSKQSQPLSSRLKLVKDAVKLELQHVGKPIPRPPQWSGYLLIPDRIEFWYGKPDRLHDRFLYTRAARGWNMVRLYP